MSATNNGNAPASHSTSKLPEAQTTDPRPHVRTSYAYINTSEKETIVLKHSSRVSSLPIIAVQSESVETSVSMPSFHLQP